MYYMYRKLINVYVYLRYRISPHESPVCIQKKLVISWEAGDFSYSYLFPPSILRNDAAGTDALIKAKVSCNNRGTILPCWPVWRFCQIIVFDYLSDSLRWDRGWDSGIRFIWPKNPEDPRSQFWNSHFTPDIKNDRLPIKMSTDLNSRMVFSGIQKESKDRSTNHGPREQMTNRWQTNDKQWQKKNQMEKDFDQMTSDRITRTTETIGTIKPHPGFCKMQQLKYYNS